MAKKPDETQPDKMAIETIEIPKGLKKGRKIRALGALNSDRAHLS